MGSISIARPMSTLARCRSFCSSQSLARIQYAGISWCVGDPLVEVGDGVIVNDMLGWNTTLSVVVNRCERNVLADLRSDVNPVQQPVSTWNRSFVRTLCGNRSLACVVIAPGNLAFHQKYLRPFKYDDVASRNWHRGAIRFIVNEGGAAPSGSN